MKKKVRTKIYLPSIGRLRINEVSKIAELFKETGSWDKVCFSYNEANISQSTRNATPKRYFSYVKGMISSWSDDEVNSRQ